MFMKAFVP